MVEKVEFYEKPEFKEIRELRFRARTAEGRQGLG
jgi:hypothetical protein